MHSTSREEFAVVWDREDELLGCLFQPNGVIFWDLEKLGLKRYASLLGVCEKR